MMSIADNIITLIRQNYMIEDSDDRVELDSRLTDDLAFDSLDVVELKIDIEDEYGIIIPDEVNFNTVEGIVKYVEAQING